MLAFIFFSCFNAAHFVQSGYTNHAGNVVAGWPIALTKTQVTLGMVSNHVDGVQTSIVAPSETYPLSIFPESERHRMAVDFGEPCLSKEVKQVIAGVERAMERSRKRAAKGLCTKEESEAFCAKSSAALRTYLNKQRGHSQQF